MSPENSQPRKTDQTDQPLDQFVTNLQRQKEEEYTRKRAAELNMQYQNLTGFQPNPAAVGLVPKDLANSANIFAYDKDGTKIMLAISDPETAQTIDALKKIATMDEYEFRPVLVSESSMRYLLSVYDTFSPAELKSQDISVSQAEQEKYSKLTSTTALQTALQDTSASQMMELVFAGATGLNASDIHIEPTQTEVRLRYRLDGVLQDVATLPATQLDTIINRIKLTAKLKLNIKAAAQDGRFSITTVGGVYDIRVSILPTQYGESAVLRLLPQEGKFVSLDEIGFSPEVKQWVDAAIHEPNGLILNTGPTGSGKTTTLYAVLNTINTPETKIITVEDPIEYRLQGVTQTQVNEEEGYGFANALRSIVRQDPDIILVGEIRDNETAEIAVNAALTGHLVLSTLHTNDAAGSIPRLIDLGAQPKLFADAMRLIIAQRLVRRLCPKCKQAYTPSADELTKIKAISSDAAPTQLYHSGNCDDCNGTGFKGRIGVFEVLRITPEIKAKIVADASASEIHQIAIEQGMITLAQDGLARVIDGTTTLEELFRVVGTEHDN
ncbi:MAG: GspE/PulE family protein [Patescibacteria group bacterium]|jgi:type IV pilus assembly protein PilB